jgi:uncharacterized membrane protein YhaH (DUF805 family)
MTSGLQRLAFSTMLVLTAHIAIAQQRPSNPSDAAGCAACGGLLFFIIALFVLNIALLIWVARDAKARGMDSSVLWMLLVLFTGIIGLVIYLFSRPQGNLIPCSNCGNKKLQAAMRCPHCGFGA